MGFTKCGEYSALNGKIVIDLGIDSILIIRLGNDLLQKWVFSSVLIEISLKRIIIVCFFRGISLNTSFHSWVLSKANVDSFNFNTTTTCWKLF